MSALAAMISILVIVLVLGFSSLAINNFCKNRQKRKQEEKQRLAGKFSDAKLEDCEQSGNNMGKTTTNQTETTVTTAPQQLDSQVYLDHSQKKLFHGRFKNHELRALDERKSKRTREQLKMRNQRIQQRGQGRRLNYQSRRYQGQQIDQPQVDGVVTDINEEPEYLVGFDKHLEHDQRYFHRDIDRGQSQIRGSRYQREVEAKFRQHRQSQQRISRPWQYSYNDQESYNGGQIGQADGVIMVDLESPQTPMNQDPTRMHSEHAWQLQPGQFAHHVQNEWKRAAPKRAKKRKKPKKKRQVTFKQQTNEIVSIPRQSPSDRVLALNDRKRYRSKSQPLRVSPSQVEIAQAEYLSVPEANRRQRGPLGVRSHSDMKALALTDQPVFDDYSNKWPLSFRQKVPLEELDENQLREIMEITQQDQPYNTKTQADYLGYPGQPTIKRYNQHPAQAYQYALERDFAETRDSLPRIKTL